MTHQCMSLHDRLWVTTCYTVVQLDMWSTTIMFCSFCVAVRGEEIQQTCSSLCIIPVFSWTCMYLCFFFVRDMRRKTKIIYVFFNTRFIKWIPNWEAMSVCHNKHFISENLINVYNVGFHPETCGNNLIIIIISSVQSVFFLKLKLDISVFSQRLLNFQTVCNV